MIPGAGGQAAYWHLVVPRLEAAGHRAIAVDLPAADPDAGLREYLTAVEQALDASGADADDLVVVGQSLGGLVAPIVAAHRDAAEIVLVAPMIPKPGESGGDWWVSTGQPAAAAEAARRDGRDPDAPFDPFVSFLHDVGDDVVRSMPETPPQSDRPFGQPWPLPEWPEIPTRVIAGRFDRFFPFEFIQRISRDRLGIEPEIIGSGHLPALARPDDLVELLLRSPS